MQRILKAVKHCLCVYINISIDIHASVNYMRVIPSVNQMTSLATATCTIVTMNGSQGNWSLLVSMCTNTNATMSGSRAIET